MIARCHQRFSVSSGIFGVGDVLAHRPKASYDFVVASGVFGLGAHGAHARIRPTLERMFEWCRVGIAVNFLSARAAEKAQQRLYMDPAEALGWALELTPAASLDHTYLPNDFTLHLRRTPAWLESTSGEIE